MSPTQQSRSFASEWSEFDIYTRLFSTFVCNETEIYAKSNPEIKRKAIEEASSNIMPKEKFSAKEKEDLFEWLKTVI